MPTLSQAQFGITVTRGWRVPMRDGVQLAVDVVRPDADGRFPAILGYSPYHKPTMAAYTSAAAYFAERGYAVVEFDLRGTGDSGGASVDMYAPEEIQDGCDMVEWVAAQPWCDGNVGMCGISYGGVVCWQVAMHQPPHLKAIIVRSGTDDAYTDWVYPGGSPRPFCFETYAPQMTASNFAPPNAALCGDRWQEIWQQHLEQNVPWGIEFIRNQLDGPYWRGKSVRPDYDRVQCPVFVIGGWADWYPTPLLRAFAGLSVPKRALVGPWSHYWPERGIPGPRVDGMRECLKWFDQWLKGMDTGVLAEPPVTLFVRTYTEPATARVVDNGAWRHETEWPPARVENTPFYLQSDGGLGNEPCRDAATDCDRHRYDPTIGMASGRHAGGAHGLCGMPGDQRPDEALSLVYTTKPLDCPVEIMGCPQAVLHVSSSAEVAAFCVKLSDVAPDGTSALVTKGYLNGTHRESHNHPTPLEPGEVVELRIELLAAAYRFQAGHRLRVAVASADFPDVWPTPSPCVIELYHDAERPSRILLPSAPEQSPELPAPDLQPSPHPLPDRDALPRGDLVVSQDLANGTCTISQQRDGLSRSHFTVSSEHPAHAVAKATFSRTTTQAGAAISVQADCTTSSDDKAFHHVVSVSVQVDGKPFFHKSWDTSVPREMN